MVTKLTKRERYEILLTYEEVRANPDMVDFIQHEIDLLAKRKAKSGEARLAMPKAIENDACKQEILKTMIFGKRYTINDLLEIVPNQPIDMTHNRMVALVAHLIADCKVVRVKYKRETYFMLA